MLLVHNADHLFPRYLERCAGAHGDGRSQAKSRQRRERLFSYKVAFGQERDSCFLSGLRDDRDLGATFLKIEDGIRRISLRKEGLSRRQLNDSSPQSGLPQKCFGIECEFFHNSNRFLPSCFLRINSRNAAATCNSFDGNRGSLAPGSAHSTEYLIDKSHRVLYRLSHRGG